MHNKRLEERLKKDGKNAGIIQILEKCEGGLVAEIRISKSEGFTGSVILDKMIFTYLEKLKVNVVYVSGDEVAESEEEDDKPKCQNEVHRVLQSTMKKGTKTKTLLKGKYTLVKIDLSTFVICPSCLAIKEVK
jgi:hypothetical protein